MAGIVETYVYTRDDLEALINQARKNVITWLADNNEIDQETYDEWTTHYAILLREPTFFGKIWKKLLKDTDTNRLHMILIRNSSLSPDDSKPEKGVKLEILPCKKNEEKEKEKPSSDKDL